MFTTKKESMTFISFLWFLSSLRPSWDILNSTLSAAEYWEADWVCPGAPAHCLVLIACEPDQYIQTHVETNYFTFQLDFQCPMKIRSGVGLRVKTTGSRLTLSDGQQPRAVLLQWLQASMEWSTSLVVSFVTLLGISWRCEERIAFPSWTPTSVASTQQKKKTFGLRSYHCNGSRNPPRSTLCFLLTVRAFCSSAVKSETPTGKS